jgi:hypothetical protein
MGCTSRACRCRCSRAAVPELCCAHRSCATSAVLKCMVNRCSQRGSTISCFNIAAESRTGHLRRRQRFVIFILRLMLRLAVYCGGGGGVGGEAGVMRLGCRLSALSSRFGLLMRCAVGDSGYSSAVYIFVSCPLGCFISTNSSVGSVSACSLCPPGHFNDIFAATSCAACSAGSYSPGTQPAPSCTLCSPGTHSSIKGCER